MTSLGNKEIMSQNLKYYIEKSGMDRKTLAEIWGFPYSTVSDWVNGKKYPRIDRIEIMARYFGVMKSDLIEEHISEDMKKDHDAITDAVVRMRTDAEFFNIVERLLKMEPSELSGVQQMLDALKTFSK